MAITKFSNDTKADRNFSQKSKKGLVPKNRLRQNIKKKSERARANTRKQKLDNNYEFFGPETVVVRRHRNDFRKHPSNYNLEFFGEMEEIDLQFEFKYDYTWWYELLDEEPDYCSQEPRFRECSPQPVTYYQDDSDSDSDCDEDYGGYSRFARNDGWDIDEYQPVELSTQKQSSLSEEFQKTVMQSLYIRKHNNEKLQIEIQRCDITNQIKYNKIKTNSYSDETRMSKRRRLNKNGDYQYETSDGQIFKRIEELDRQLGKALEDLDKGLDDVSERQARLDRLDYNYGMSFNMTTEEEDYYFRYHR